MTSEQQEKVYTLAEVLAFQLMPRGLDRFDAEPNLEPSDQERAEGKRMATLVENVLRNDPDLLVSIGWDKVVLRSDGDKLRRGITLYLSPGY